MIPKEIKYNLHYEDLQGDFLRLHTVQNQIQKSKIKVKKECRRVTDVYI